MIKSVNFENAHLCGPALASQYKLRHRSFIERQDYNVSTYQSMEYDEYDNPSSVYLVYQSDDGEALGASRLTPVYHRCMLKDLGPDMVSDHSLFNDYTVWEGTRFCVEKTLEPDFRRHIIKTLVLGYHEFALANGVSKIIGMMPTLIWKSVLLRNGCHCTELGSIKIIDGQKVQAISIDINEESYQSVKNKTKIQKRVILNDQ